jgi:two-component system alkaline phosphatase synthesis response regulator PhoP
MAQERILIVDDEPHITELLRVNLDAAGYDVASAANGREAMERIDAARPDLIIMDVMMPEMDGWELCKTIKDDPDMTGVRIIMLTARDTDRDRLIGDGIFSVDEYVTKPFDVGMLMSLCRRLLHE